MTATVRPPLTPLQTAALRQQSANREYRRHLAESQCWRCEQGRFCRILELLDRAASIADHEHARLLMGVRG